MPPHPEQGPQVSTLPARADTLARWTLALSRAALLLMAVVVVASAWLRLAAPRPACIDWPGCRSAMQPALGHAAVGALGDGRVLAGVRLAHRVAASLLLPAVIALALLAVRARARPLVAQAFGMGLLAFGLAALGIVTPGARSPWILLGNQLGGLVLLALAWSTWHGLRTVTALPSRTARWALAGAALWAAQAGFGALSGAPAGVRPDEAATLLHLALALPALLWAGAVGMTARRSGRRTEGSALVAVAAAQALLGALAAGMAAPLALVLAHSALAATGLALLAGLAGTRSQPSVRQERQDR